MAIQKRKAKPKNKDIKYFSQSVSGNSAKEYDMKCYLCCKDLPLQYRSMEFVLVTRVEGGIRSCGQVNFPPWVWQ